MCSFYAFCRVVDDIVDSHDTSAEAKEKEIHAWRQEVRRCYEQQAMTPLGKELQKIIQTYLIPPTPLFDILDGVETDVHQSRYETFDDLYQYCYRVASAVGLVSIEIFGYSDPQARDYAVDLGLAFQLTNILRDVRYDLEEYDRVYLPQSELEEFGVKESDFLIEKSTVERDRLLHFQYHRAESYFHRAARLLPERDRENFVAAELMTEVYYRLLQKLYGKGFPFGIKPCRLNRLEKLVALKRAATGARINDQRSPRKHIVVMGAGFAGMSAAYHLSRFGHQVELLESKQYVGGRAHSFLDAHTGVTLDNGQHIFMGCYYECMDLLKRLHVIDRLDRQTAVRVPFLNRERKPSLLDGSRWPFPFHMLGALLYYRELSLSDRLNMLRFGWGLILGPKPDESTTAKEWMDSLHQSERACLALWEPFCVAALNEPMKTASACLLWQVLRQSLFGSAEDGSIYVSQVGLSDLMMPELERSVQATGGAVHHGEGVHLLEFEDQQITKVRTTKGREITPDACVSALSWQALSSLLPEDQLLTRQAQQIQSSPIVAVHLLVDQLIHDQPFVGFLDSPVHWVFDRTRQLSGTEHEGNYLYSIVISAAYEMRAMKNDQLMKTIWDELVHHYPHLKSAQILHKVVYKSTDATFAARPETEKLRPKWKTPWDNLVLAGDWTQTGLPATLEGAVLSGSRAAHTFY